MTPDEAREAAVEAMARARCLREAQAEITHGDCNGKWTKHPDCALAALLALPPETLAALIGLEECPTARNANHDVMHYAFPDTEAGS